MRRIMIVLGMAVFCVSRLVWSMDRLSQIYSLSDLPLTWEGIAGDLIVRVPAAFKIEKIKKATRVDSSKPFPVIYDVNASFSFGERKVAVHEIELFSASSQNAGERELEVMIKLEDEMTPSLLAAIRYDEVTQQFTLKELSSPPRQKRFILTGRAR